MPAGRPIKETEARPLEDIDPSTIAPLTKDGVPDMYNFMPTRFVPQDEAEARGWSHFYDGRTCRYGHQSPRYVSNYKLCVDCKRIKEGKTPIGGKAGGTHEVKQPVIPRGLNGPIAISNTAVKPVEPDTLEKKFLVEYAAVKDLDRAAHLVGSTAAQIHMRLSTSAVFRAACNDLESRLNIRPTVPDPEIFQWDEDKRTRLLTVFIDTGDIATARDAIRVTASEYHAEMERNSSFAERYERAYPLAMQTFEEVAKQLAKMGNDKLLALILKAERPDKFNERVKVDLNVTEKLTDEQIRNQLERLFIAARARRVTATVIDATPRAIEGVGIDAGGSEESESESNLDLL